MTRRTAGLASAAAIVSGIIRYAPTAQDGEPQPDWSVFASGRTAEASLLIGADGIWSATRSLLDPHAPTPEYAGRYSISGIAEGIETDAGIFNMTPRGGMTAAGRWSCGTRTGGAPPFTRTGAFIHLAAPGGKVWWSAQVACPAQPDLALTDAQWLHRLGELHRHEQLPTAILEATTELHRPTLMHKLNAVPVLHNDRIALLGDAGHPVGAGQGASMALEDALVLAQSLAAEPSVAAALSAYEAARSARIARMVKAASDNRDAKTAGPLTRRIRDLVMPLAVRLFYEKATAWLYTHDCGELLTIRTDGDSRASGARL
ncbi:FAD-dependent monooxygenase [Streptomyces lavendulocolor]|uniref:FAD-dependent monooxygenase n=1 Tax=Streptomyces lavendulocolor TaxID=67316 RepID=UPI003C2C5548